MKSNFFVNSSTKSKSYYVALYGIMFATTFVAMMIDRLISLALPISMACCVLLVTFSFCMIRNEWLTGLLSGVFFGLASFVKAIIFAETLNINPLVSILPRIFVGISAFAVYRLMVLLLKNVRKSTVRQAVSISVGTFVGLAVNTILYLTALNLWKQYLSIDFKPLFAIVKVVLFSNIIPEYLVSIILTPTVVLGVRKALHYSAEPVAVDNRSQVTDTEEYTVDEQPASQHNVNQETDDEHR
ncbi:MAG: hypothetical protein PHW00_01735 [Clostridia bacterium]|nr:hypothetical protein [Clostridia bacterium]